MVKKKNNKKIRIALDAMGGDHAPDEVLKGCLEASKDNGLEIVLVGPESLVKERLENYSPNHNSGISFVNATQVIEMGDKPVTAVKEKRDSSIVVGIDLLDKREVSAFVSAGNTGAIMTAAWLTLGRKRGVNRPALGAVFPFPTGPVLCLDLGANADCKPGTLAQFGQMGHIYMRKIFRIESPRIGLLSSGEEDTKGSQMVQKAHKILKRSKLNFIGNVEGRDIASGKADVIVTDGFTGNVLLKLGEGLGEMLLTSLRKAVAENPALKEAALLLEPTFQSVIGTLDYRQYGGALLFGVNGNVIVAHGRSDAEAIKNAVNTARRAIAQEVVEAIGS